jgi:hypothetical protein
MAKYELVIVWQTGEKEVTDEKYETYEDAERIADGIKMALGNQVSWIGAREAR